MADLTEIQAADSVKIIGSDAAGVETTPVASTANGDLKTADISDNGGLNGSVTVGTSAVEAKVAVSTLSNRKVLTISHNGNGKLYWGLSNSVTTSNGTQIFKNTMATFDVGPNTHIWLISDLAGNDVRIAEFA